jgi:thiol:disulfide interchange protein
MRLQFGIRSLLVVFVVVALGTWLLANILRNRPPKWEPYSSATLQLALQRNQPVLITLSADWDPICRIHETTAINSTDSYRFIRDHGLVTLRADLTNNDPAAFQLLRNHGLVSMPAFLLYHPAFPHDPLILRDAVSKEQLQGAIRSNGKRAFSIEE